MFRKMMKYVITGLNFGITLGVAAFVATLVYMGMMILFAFLFGKDKNHEKKQDNVNFTREFSFDDDLK